MKKAILGITFGIIAGIIDVIPMAIRKLPLEADISAFSMWVVVGLFVSLYKFRVPVPIGSGITAFLVLLPSAILIGWKEPFSLVPIAFMTLVIGFLLGLGIGFTKKKMNLD
jgi:hypothetical protein